MTELVKSVHYSPLNTVESNDLSISAKSPGPVCHSAIRPVDDCSQTLDDGRHLPQCLVPDSLNPSCSGRTNALDSYLRSRYSKIGHPSSDHCGIYRPSPEHLEHDEHDFKPTNFGITGCCNHHQYNCGCCYSPVRDNTHTLSSGSGATLGSGTALSSREIAAVQAELRAQGPSARLARLQAEKHREEQQRLREQKEETRKRLDADIAKQLEYKRSLIQNEAKSEEDEKAKIEASIEKERLDNARRKMAMQKEMREALDKQTAGGGRESRAKEQRVVEKKLREQEMAAEKEERKRAAEERQIYNEKQQRSLKESMEIHQRERARHEAAEAERKAQERKIADTICAKAEAERIEEKREKAQRQKEFLARTKEMFQIKNNLLQNAEAEFLANENARRREEEKRLEERRKKEHERRKEAIAETHRAALEARKKRQELAETERQREKEAMAHLRKTEIEEKAQKRRMDDYRNNELREELQNQIQFNIEKKLCEAALE